MRLTTEFRVEGLAGSGGGWEEEAEAAAVVDVGVCGLAIDITDGSAEDGRAVQEFESVSIWATELSWCFRSSPGHLPAEPALSQGFGGDTEAIANYLLGVPKPTKILRWMSCRYSPKHQMSNGQK